MEQSISIKLLAIVFLIAGGQTPNNTKPVLGSDIPVAGNSVQIAEGVIYFSYDNGITWENKSTGLPSTTNIGLSGIAVSGNKLALISKDRGLYFFNTKDDKWVNVPTDKQLIESNVGALLFYNDWIYAGTQTGGVFYSKDDGKSWTKLNTGLDNLTIRKITVVENKLYAATNSGLYSYNSLLNKWELAYGNSTLQVNGITDFAGSIYIATSQGAFTSPIGKKDWKKVFSNGALHNISSDDKALYAMVYNELFSSYDKGQTWQNIQNGLPAQLYTFNVVKIDNTLLAGQWDGVYRKDGAAERWKFSGKGLPGGLAVVNMQVYNKIVVISGNVRKLKAGMTTDR